MYKKTFTLLELLLVLTIFAVASTIALNTVLGNIEEAFFQATEEQFQSLEKAILGVENSHVGYIAEMGGPPTRLEDLWIHPNPNGKPFGKKNANDGSGVEFYCGWRGPYLRPAIGKKEIRDGWGNPFVLCDQNGNPTDFKVPADILLSLGADRQIGGKSENDRDTALIFCATETAVNHLEAVPFKQDLYHATLDIFIRYQEPSMGSILLNPDSRFGAIHIRYYHPDPQTGEIRFTEQKITAPFSPNETFKRSIPATIGPRALRIFQSNGVQTLTSSAHYLTVRRGNQPEEIILILAP